MKTKYYVGQKVIITMSDHFYIGETGIVEMIMTNIETIPDAILVKMPDDFTDWFFGDTKNLKPCSAET